MNDLDPCVMFVLTSFRFTVFSEDERKAVKEAKIGFSDGTDLPSITISMGIAQMCPGCTPANLIEAADQQLYLAKQKGRDRFCADFSE